MENLEGLFPRLSCKMNLRKGYKEKPVQYIATGFKFFRSPNYPNFLLYFKLYPKMTCYIIIQHFQNQIKWMSPWILDAMLNVFFEILVVLDLSDPNFVFWAKHEPLLGDPMVFSGAVVITIAQVHSAKTDLSFCTGSNLTACWRFAIMRTTDKCLSLVNFYIKQLKN